MRKQDERDGSIGEDDGRIGEPAGHGAEDGRISELARDGEGGRIGSPVDDGDGEAALAGIDLDAWAPPSAPSAGALADAVIARARQPAGAPALEAVELEATARGRGPGRGRSGRRWPIALAAAVGAAAAVAIVLATGRGGEASAPAASQGEIAQVQQQVRELRERLDTAEQALAARWQQRQEGSSVADGAAADGASADGAANDRAAIDRAAIDGIAIDGTAAGSVAGDRSESLPGLAPGRPRAPRAQQQQQTPARTSSGSGCDADALLEKGKQYFADGQLAAAFVALEASYACRPDPQTAVKAFVAACNLPSVAKAAWGWRRMAPAQRQMAVAICLRNGITEDDLNRAGLPQRTTGKP